MRMVAKGRDHMTLPSRWMVVCRGRENLVCVGAKRSPFFVSLLGVVATLINTVIQQR